jgi:predicted nuclease of restriction endonuclease-like RecB superfamily
VIVQCPTAAGYRYLFRKIKFLRLLFTIHALDDGRYRLELDGPFSMFESTTRYGLQLAMLYPALQQCERFDLTAEVRWGPERQALTFRDRGGTGDQAVEVVTGRLPEEVEALAKRIGELTADWRVVTNNELLHLPGLGLCVPDLRFEHLGTGQCVYVEVMGYWSRPAVWQRVELVEKGLPYKILFAVGERLRVSEKVLDEKLPAALYVYKGTMNARAVLDRVNQLAERP